MPMVIVMVMVIIKATPVVHVMIVIMVIIVVLMGSKMMVLVIVMLVSDRSSLFVFQSLLSTQVRHIRLLTINCYYHYNYKPLTKACSSHHLVERGIQVIGKIHPRPSY